MHHELVKMSVLIDWDVFDDKFGVLYHAERVCPGKPTRLMVGLLYSKHTHKLCDEQLVSTWLEIPCWQFFCGESYFQIKSPIDPSSLTRYRQRIGKSGCKWLLQQTLGAGLNSGTVRKSHLKRVTADTTVQDKAVSFPTDAKLLNRSRQRLVRLCHQHRVVRDIERKIHGNDQLVQIFAEELKKAKRLLNRQRDRSNKLYSLHAPEVECISKGKAHQRYEFGVKTSIAVTNRSNFVIGGLALPGNPYDGHTLKGALAQVRKLCGQCIEEAYVDRGYRGHDKTESVVYISGQRRGVTDRIRRCLKHRQAIEPIIGHMKQDGWLGCNHLKGSKGDSVNVLLSCAGHNLRLILKRLRDSCVRIICHSVFERISRLKRALSGANYGILVLFAA